MLIGSPYGKMYFLKSAKQTTGIASINSKQLKNFPALIPPLELQNKLTEIIRQTEQIQKHQTQSNQQIDDLFNALIQQAFR
jgi:type I restriction enzyme S subunit